MFIGFTNNVQAHTISDSKVDKEFVLCAIDTAEQLVAPDNDITAGGIINANSWTFVLLEEGDTVVEADAEDFAGSEFNVEETETEDGRDISDLDVHAAVNGQPHSVDTDIDEDDDPDTLTPHYKCVFAEDKIISAPGPSLSVDIGDTVRITLVSDIGNEHVHSIDQHALNGDEHVNSGPIHIGHKKTWIWKADQAGSFLYHCAGNGLVNLWTHINNGMYGNIVVQPKMSNNDDDDDNGNGPAVEYSVMFSDMYLTLVDGEEEGDPKIGTFGMTTFGGIFLDDHKTLEVTNGQAFNYAPFIGSDWEDGDHAPLTLNAIDLEADDVGGVPILAPVDKVTRWYITNPGPNEFLAWHFIAGQMDVRDGSTPKKLMTPVANEETWTVPPGSSSTTDTVFPSVGPYIGITHKLSDVVKGGAFAVVACDIKKPENNENHPLSELLCNDIGGIESIEDIIAFNAAINPKVIVKEI